MNSVVLSKAPAMPVATMGEGAVFGVLGDLRADPLGTFCRALREPSEIVKLRLGLGHALLLKHPAHVEHVLVHNAKNWSKKIRHYQMLRLSLGNGLVTSEGSFWLRQRRLAQPAFHRARLIAFADVMSRAADEMVDGWDEAIASGATVDVAAEMMRVTLRIVCHTLLGTDVAESEEVARAIGFSNRFIDERAFQIFSLPVAIPSPDNVRFKRAMATLDRIVYRIIAERRAQGGDRGDLLSMFMAARDEESGETMSDLQLRDEVMTMFVAGHETTACALSWTFHLLSKHPGVASELRAKIVDAIGSAPVTLESIKRVPLLERVVKESIRLYPPVWTIGRAASDDDVIDGVPVKAGDAVFLAPYVTHRHPAFWENPEGFDPDRFLPEVAQRRPRFAYFPFGGGPRQCIGDAFALMEAQIVVAAVLRRVRLSLAPWHKVEMEPLITLRPKGGLPMHVTT